MQRIETIVHARAGLLGNPSDGYYGKTLSCLVGNFAARVTLEESERLTLTLNHRLDPLAFDNLGELAETYGGQGYYGGLRLLQAACKRFTQVCSERGIYLEGPNFTMSYDTVIPRQVGLSGSSGIVIAALRCLMQWYSVEKHFSQPEFPGLALDVEQKDLGITAGLQDRVVQTYGGVVYMDFAQELVESRGYGEYTPVDPALLPPLFLAYVLNPSDSGKIHSDVRRRWVEGDPEVHEAMRTFASFAEDGLATLRAGQSERIGEMMNRAFSLRRRIFGDAVLGPDNLRIVALAKEHGLTGTTSGSGGGIIGPMGEPEQNAAYAKALQDEGYRFLRVEIGPPYPWPSSVG